MKRFACLLGFATLLLAAGDATASRRYEPIPSNELIRYESAANEALEAMRASDVDRLERIGAYEHIDPWVLVELLCLRGESEAATSLAAAVSRPGCEGLVTYVARRVGRPADGRRRVAELARLRHHLAVSDATLLELEPEREPDMETVLGLMLVADRGRALWLAGRYEEGTRLLATSARGAESLGWLRLVAVAASYVTDLARQRGDLEAARVGLQRASSLSDTLGLRRQAALQFGHLSRVLRKQGRSKEALAAAERAVALCESLGDHASLCSWLVEAGGLRLMLGDSDDARVHFERALDCLRAVGRHPAASYAFLNLGRISLRERDADGVRDHAGAALTLGESHRQIDVVLQSLSMLAEMYVKLGDDHRALSHMEREIALRVSREGEDGVGPRLRNLATLQWRAGRQRDALASYQRLLAIAKAGGDRDLMLEALGKMSRVCLDTDDYRWALTYGQQALDIVEPADGYRALCSLLITVGAAHANLGNTKEGLSIAERVLAIAEENEDVGQMRVALHNLGDAHLAVHEYEAAKSSYRRSLAIARQMNLPEAEMALTLRRLAHVHRHQGDLRRALQLARRALALAEAAHDDAEIGGSLISLGVAHWALGNQARALSLFERSYDIHRRLGRPSEVAVSLGNLGGLRSDIGDQQGALTHLRRALEIHESLGHKQGIATATGNIGGVLYEMEEYPRAIVEFERARATAEEIGDQWSVARHNGNLANAHHKIGDHTKATSLFQAAIATYRSLGDRRGEALTRGHLGFHLGLLGDHFTALEHLDAAVRTLRRVRAQDLLASALANTARIQLISGEPGRALLSAQQALTALETVLTGLAEEEGGGTRAKHEDVFAAGVLAAARLGEPEHVASFLESGRAGSLLEMLSDARDLRYAQLPAALLDAESEAKERLSSARRAYDHALASGDRQELRQGARALDDAMNHARAVASRIQREAKRVAGLFYPRPATIEELRDWLGEEEALVLYGLYLDEALALVLTPNEERIVSLGSASAVEEACAGFQVGVRSATPRGPLAEADVASGSPGLGLDRVRHLLVDPLALPDSVRTVLVAPDGPICYVPFGALFDGRAVALTPSGTTHVLLMEEEHGRGEQVLALGDPSYGDTVDAGAAEVYRGGAKLTALPATRDEAIAVGDVTLLGDEANEAALRDAIGRQKRWRAVHLACHGLVDPERPTLSSLALVPAGDEDGFLTALEVIRMEIPADLAVLSACETGTGKIVKGEGIVGLTRAFMYAGAPRVLCSLWKVDDDATRALMEKFYALWNPTEGEGVAAAEALREAQAFVRGHEKWAHPYYWAAWVLWGLP